MQCSDYPTRCPRHASKSADPDWPASEHAGRADKELRGLRRSLERRTKELDTAQHALTAAGAANQELKVRALLHTCAFVLHKSCIATCALLHAGKI